MRDLRLGKMVISDGMLPVKPLYANNQNKN